MRFSEARDHLGIDDYSIIDDQIWNEIAYYFTVIRHRKRVLH